jgi:hypothetical protein
LGFEERVSREQALSKTVAWELANPPDEIDAKQFDYAAEDAVIENLRKNNNVACLSGAS